MKKFINPELELIELEEKDVIVTSGGQIPLNGDPEIAPDENSPAQSLKWTNLDWNNWNKNQ